MENWYMRNFLKSLFAGLVGLLGLFLWLPARLFANDGERSIPEPRFTPPPAPQPANVPLTGLSLALKHSCLMILLWAKRTLKDGTQELPPRMARDIQKWLPGLTRDELSLLICAGIPGISGHICGTHLIDRVPQVSSLPPLHLEAPTHETAPANDDELQLTRSPTV
jgi:hypothetical protein